MFSFPVLSRPGYMSAAGFDVSSFESGLVVGVDTEGIFPIDPCSTFQTTKAQTATSATRSARFETVERSGQKVAGGL